FTISYAGGISMADDPQEFMGTKEQYERLRGALTKLTDDGVRPVTILALAKVRCDRGVINKFCKPDGTDRLSFNTAAALWTYLAAKRLTENELSDFSLLCMMVVGNNHRGTKCG